MCGIAGFYNIQVESNKYNILDCLKDRGPDDNGVWNDSKISLFQTRLSIIDIGDRGHQPMKSFDNRYVIVFNGEIYNYVELRTELKNKGYFFETNSDTEVLLNAYHCFGKKCLNMLRGMFAFGIWDTTEKTLFIARDRMGIKPILYFHSNNKFAFASNIKTLIQNIKHDFKIRENSVDDLFNRGSIAQPFTIIKNIFNLPPGTFAIINSQNDLHIEKYWNLEEEMNINLEINRNLTYSNALRLNKEILYDAMKHHIVSDVEIGSFLSGGIDSAIVTKLLSETISNKLKTFSLGYLSTKNNIDELVLSRKTAKYFNSEHYERIISGNDVFINFEKFINQLDQPSSDGLNTYFVSELASKNVKVAMSGLGADEIYAGYNLFKDRQKSTLPGFSKVFNFFNQIHSNRFTKKMYENSLSDIEYYSNLRNISNKSTKLYYSSEFKVNIEKDNKIKPYLNIIKSPKGYLHNTTIIECNRYLLDTLLRDSDSTSMAHSIELRPIFLDHKVVEFATSLPYNYKIINNETKFILKDTFKNELPNHIFNKPKRGFNLPIEEWINNDLSELFFDISKNKNLLNIFNIDFLNRIFDLKSNKEPHTKWMFLVLSYWLKQNKFI